jgi:small conductance mechanosensitive channel
MKLDQPNLHRITQVYLVPLVLRIVVALAIFIVGRWLAKAVVAAFARVMERSRIDVSVRKFLADVLYAVLLAAVVIAADI